MTLHSLCFVIVCAVALVAFLLFGDMMMFITDPGEYRKGKEK